MVATAAASAFFPVGAPATSSATSAKASMMPDNLDARGIKPKPASSSGLQVKANAHASPKINGSKVSTDTLKGEDTLTSSPAPRTFINQLPDWSMFLAAITTIFLAAEKQWTNLDWKPRRPDMLADPFGIGRFMQDGLIFRQHFAIRSYEIGADRTASIETLMNHLQVEMHPFTFLLGESLFSFFGLISIFGHSEWSSTSCVDWVAWGNQN